MSWLFGMNKGQGGQSLVEPPQVPTFEGGGDNQNKNGGQPDGGLGGNVEGYRSEAYSFDSTALERAAKAAKVTKLVDALYNSGDRKRILDSIFVTS